MNDSAQIGVTHNIDYTLVSEALSVFERCVCILESNIDITPVIKLIFATNLLLILGGCGDCKEEIRWTRRECIGGKRLLLISEEEVPVTSFDYSDVLLIQGGKLYRMVLPLASGSQFLPFAETYSSFTKGKIANLAKREIRAYVYDCPPLIRMMNITGVYWGLDIDLMKALSQALNFKIKYIKFNDTDTWGSVVNGTWVGGINGAIVKGEIDIGLCGARMREKDMSYVDVIPYEEIALGFLISSKPTEEKWKSIFSPFGWDLWGCLFLTIVLSFTSMFLLSKLSGKKEGLMDWIFLVFGHFMGTVSLPSEGPTAFRAAGTGVAVSALMFTTLYSSAILSHLTSPPVIPPPETVEDLVNRGYYWSRSKPVKDPGEILSEADRWQRKFMKRYRNISDMGPAIKSKRFAYYLSYIGQMYLWREIPRFSYITGDVSFTKMKEVISKYSVGIATKKGSILTAHLSLAIDRLVAGGIINKIRLEKEEFIKLHWLAKVPGNPGPQSLTLASLQGAFFLWLCGLLLSTVVFTIEIYLTFREKNKMKNESIVDTTSKSISCYH